MSARHPRHSWESEVNNTCLLDILDTAGQEVIMFANHPRHSCARGKPVC